MINSLTVYCSSSTEAPQEYFEAAASLGKSCAALNISLVFGGGRVGLMGCIADAVMQNGGTARGIIPGSLKSGK